MLVLINLNKLLFFTEINNIISVLNYEKRSMVTYLFSCGLLFFFLFTQNNIQMLEITHTYTSQLTTYELWVTQQLMMVFTLTCKYYKNIT